MQAELEELEALAKELLPEDHPLHPHLQRSLRVLQVPVLLFDLVYCICEAHVLFIQKHVRYCRLRRRPCRA